MPVSVNLAEVLDVCVRGALAAQQYIALDLLKLSELTLENAGDRPPASILELGEEQRQQLLRSLNASVVVDVKAELAYKEGEASQDLVTTADVLTQAVVVEALSAAFPNLPFTIVGEEDADAAVKSAAMAAKLAHCLATYYRSGEAVMPCAEAFHAHLAQQPESTARGMIAAASVEELRRRVSIYIDPIDGTNCFVTGVWQSPMTLIGITLDGLPLAAVMNRVFLYPIGRTSEAKATPPCDSISYVWNLSPAVRGSSFMVHEGQRVPLERPAGATPALPADAVLQVAQSSTTKTDFFAEISQRLRPSQPVLARGAGNKLFTLIEKTLAGKYGARQHRGGEVVHADVFICPGHTIRKWDTCAPHAFLYALGGDVYNHHGQAVRYPLKEGDDVTSVDFSDLPDGIVATTGQASDIVRQRLQWPSANL